MRECNFGQIFTQVIVPSPSTFPYDVGSLRKKERRASWSVGSGAKRKNQARTSARTSCLEVHATFIARRAQSMTGSTRRANREISSVFFSDVIVALDKKTQSFPMHKKAFLS